MYIRLSLILAAALLGCAPPALQAQETVKIAQIIPLSGPFASAGDQLAKTFQFLIDRINAKGGMGGKKVEYLLYDSKLNPKEGIIAAEKAIESGARIVMAASGSSVAAALNDFIGKHNARNPDKETLLFHYNTWDPSTTDEACMFWQFRFTAHTDMKLAAFSKYLKSQPRVKKVYLINQDYTYGRSISVSGRRYLEAGGIAIVGDDLHPVGKGRDFSPYVTKIRQSGADAVLTGNWGDDMTLLAKAVTDAGLKTDIYTFAGNTAGVATAIGKGGVGLLKVIDDWDGTLVDAELEQMMTEFKAKTGYDFAYLRGIVMMDMLTQAVAKAGAVNARRIAAELSGKRLTNLTGEWIMRAEDHQISQPIFIATLRDNVKHGLEKTGMGYRADAKVERADTVTPVKCTVKAP